MKRVYSEETLKEAVSSVKRNRLTVSQAARDFHIPISTLYDHIKNPDLASTKGPPKQLNDEETTALVEFAKYMANQGFPLTRRMIRCYIQEIVKRSGRSTLFNLEKGPSDEWFRKLTKDHPDISFRKAESRDSGRNRMSNENVVTRFFEFWTGILKKYELTDKPGQVFNCDETGWSGKESSRTKVLGQKTGHLFQQKQITTDHVTAHLCVSADGRFIPSMLIFKGSLPHRQYKDGLPGSWLFSTSETGYMDSGLFVEWFHKAFLPHCGKARPVVLLMDNHDSHVSLPLIEAARREEVVLVGLPSHTTHFLQPLDVHVIGPLKSKVTALATDVGYVQPGTSIGKAKFPVILHHAIDQTPPSSVKEAFRLAGIFPVNQDAIDKSHLIKPSFSTNDTCEDTEPTKTCGTCGQFLGQNPLVRRGLVPASLSDILVPPAVRPVPARKRKAVTSARVISGDDMLAVLKERDEAERQREADKKKREDERESRRKKKQEEEESKRERKAKREQEKIEREEAKLKEKERREKCGKLAERKFTCGVCGVRGRVNDEVHGIEWFGCDNDECVRTGWYHLDCLSEGEKDLLRESLEDESVSWYCRACFPRFYEEEE